MGRGLCFMARYVPCDGVAVDGDEDDGEDGCHDAVAVVVVEDRDVAGWFRAPATEARTAISTSVLGDAQPLHDAYPEICVFEDSTTHHQQSL